MKDQDYKSFYDQVDRDNEYSSGKDADGHSFYPVLSKIIDRHKLKNARVLEIGSGNGRFQDIVENYTGVDVSEGLARYYRKPFYVVDDGVPYPFETESFDFVFTHAVFEHIPNINFALTEMIRVTKRGGLVLFDPAWQCRPWAAEGYQVRPYKDFNVIGMIYKASIPFRENLLFRLSHVMPKRAIFLILYLINKRAFKKRFYYRRLKANYQIYWQSDSDACNHIDPFLAILYFRANGFEVINYPGLVKQFLVRTGEILLRKK